MDTKVSAYRPNLDILRLAAATYVVLTHYLYVGPQRLNQVYIIENETINSFFNLGYVAVTLFFAISGFVIMQTVVQSTAADFAAKRLARVYPTFWLCMGLTTLVLASVGSDQRALFAQWLANLTLLPQLAGKDFIDGVYWTLMYEVIFYGWVFILHALKVLQKHLVAICAIWLLIALTNIFWLHSRPLEILLLTHHAGAFAGGMLLWQMVGKGPSLSNLAMLALALLATGGGLVSFSIYVFETWATEPTTLGFNLFLATIVFFLIWAAATSRALISRKTGLFIGGMVYPLYLLHQEVGYLLIGSLNAPPWVSVSLTVGVMIGLACLIDRAQKPLSKRMLDILRAFAVQPANRLVLHFERLGRQSTSLLVE